MVKQINILDKYEPKKDNISIICMRDKELFYTDNRTGQSNKKST